MHRRGKAFRNNVVPQDPGKDLFAFLFITILIMVFVVLMTYEQKTKNSNDSPEPACSTNSGNVSKDKIGKLVKTNNRVFIIFNNRKFNPMKESDIKEMIKNHFILENPENKGKKELLLLDEPGNGILLNDYFNAFSLFSKHEINIVFGKIKK